VFLFQSDGFKHPEPFIADICIDIDDVIEKSKPVNKTKMPMAGTLSRPMGSKKAKQQFKLETYSAHNNSETLSIIKQIGLANSDIAETLRMKNNTEACTQLINVYTKLGMMNEVLEQAHELKRLSGMQTNPNPVPDTITTHHDNAIMIEINEPLKKMAANNDDPKPIERETMERDESVESVGSLDTPTIPV
jgi:hypothetical protein